MRRSANLITGLALLLGGCVINWFRLPANSHDTLYAEDGSLFLRDALVDPWGTLFAPYDGYQHLLPRIATNLVAHLFPPEQWANAVSMSACLIVGAIAATTWWATSSLPITAGARLGLALIPVLSRVAGIEAIANVSNVHWYCLYLIPWVLTCQIKNRFIGVLAFTIALVTTCTEIQTGLFTPLAAWVFLRGKSRYGAWGWALGMAIQLASYLFQGRATGAEHPTPMEMLRGFLFNGFLGGVSAHVSANRLTVERAGWFALATVCAVLILACVVTIMRSRHSTLISLAISLPTVAACSWALAHYYLNYPALNFASGPFKLARWGTASAMLLWALVPLAAGTSTRAWVRRLAVVGLVATMAGSFVVPNSRSGTYWRPELAKAVDYCASSGADAVTLNILPADTTAEYPCEALLH